MKVSIWGTGSMALKFYYFHKNQYDVICFFDNDKAKHGTYIDGKPIVRWQGVKPLGNSYIIIASTWWKDIAVQLTEAGMRLFVDYIPVCFLNSVIRYDDIYEFGKVVGFDKIDYTLLTDKKIAVIYGNCQTRWLERAFVFYKDFAEEYLIVEVPAVFEYIRRREVIDYLISDVSFWVNIDLFIYQTIKADNRFSEKLATERILKLLNSEALKVNILNMYFAGYFPQMTVKKDRILYGIQQSGLFPFGDRYIDDMLSLGMSTDSIKSEVLREDFIPKHEIEVAVQDSIDELVKREKDVM